MPGRPYLLVAAGGALGAITRHLAWMAFGAGPMTTSMINIAGCAAIGVLAGRATPGTRWRVFLGPGVLGGFTTFSGYAVDAVTLAQHGRAWLAALQLGGTVMAALGATALGVRAGTRA